MTLVVNRLAIRQRKDVQILYNWRQRCDPDFTVGCTERKAGQRALKRHSPLKAKATATASDARGTSKVTRANLKLRSPARR